MVSMIAMVSWHVVIGVGEAIITLIAVGFVWRSRPDLIYDRPSSIKLDVRENVHSS